MEKVNVERFIYAFTGSTQDDYLQKIINEWQEYLAAGGDPDKYSTKEK